MAADHEPTFSVGRRWSGALNAALAACAALTVLVMVNYLAARHSVRTFWTADTRSQLSERTRQVLGALTNQIKVIVFFDTKDNPLFSEVSGLLKEYRAFCPKLQVEVVDYFRDVATANKVKADYGLSQINDKDLVIFDNNGRTRYVTSGELSEYDMSEVIQQKSRNVRRTSSKGEMQFTSALFSIIAPRSQRAYFLRGHGEHEPDNPDRAGYAKFAALLKNECNIPWGQASLAGEAGVPEDCSLLIIAGPVQPLVSKELSRIQHYLERGGRLLVLFNFATVTAGRPTGLEKLLANWDIAVGQNLVLDRDNSLQEGRTLWPVDLGRHPIVTPLGRAQVFLSLPRTISRVRSTAGREEGIKVEELLFTGPKSVAASEFLRGLPQEGNTLDQRGAFPLMVAAEKGAVPGVATERGATRLVVVGDSVFLKNDGIENGANSDLGAHIVNWLVDQNLLLKGLAPRPVRTYKVLMTEWQMATVRWILLLGIPGGVLVLGGLVRWRRRT